ncbi:hypothetical protein NHG85_01475 [Limimaricola sp. ASW11-118]|uniref:Outer membrane protein beta-barrel domain-containing protein n=2 Tax=Limimaricola litoreus TaxID=2955316 RepID=A0A9X2FML8_9RHOB|nr:hypothetical protein [Limimaricola litoreus]
MKRAISTAGLSAAIGLVAAAASAQGLAGGTLALETSAFFEEGAIGHTSYSGGLQFDIGLGFGAAVDLASYGFSGFGADGSNATLHALYDFGPFVMGLDGAVVGAFVGRDDYEEGDAEIYGIEAAASVFGLRGEGYLAHHDGTRGGAAVAGLSARYEITPAIFAMGEIGFADADEEGALTRVALGGGYRIDGGPRLWGELGRIEAEDEAFGGDETFLAIGAEIGFGALSGTSFGTRSLFDVVPGL